ncbi:MAG: hypothetical protein ACHQE5_12590 [Actinomycetes bacterium]
MYALDAGGHVKAGWPFAPPGIVAFGTPAVAGDGTVYVVGWAFGQPAHHGPGSNAMHLWALDPSGRVKPGWPYAAEGSMFGGDVGLSISAVGGVIFVQSLAPASVPPTYEAVELDPGGQVQAGWPVTLPGSIACGSGPCIAIAGDGTWYAMALLDQGPAAEIVALGPDGTPKPGWPVRIAGGEGFALGPGGSVYAWGSDVTGTAGTGPGPRILRTQFVVLGPDGAPRPGWPVTVTGPAGIPTIGSYGTLYTTTGGSPGQVERVMALGADGSERRGWPYTLPRDLAAWPYGPSAGMPARATSPSVGPDGTVYLLVSHAGDISGPPGLLALAPDGRVVPGWPAWLPSGARFANVGGFGTGGGAQPVPPAFGTGGTTFVAILSNGGQAAIMALDPSGHEKLGWPLAVGQGIEATTLVVGLAVDPGSGLQVTAQTDGGAITIVSVVPLTPDPTS